MFEQYNLTSFWDAESLDNDKIRRYTTEMREKYLSFWRHSLENSKKLEFYKTFKDEYSTSHYLYQLRYYDVRQNFVKFKISNHKIMIELNMVDTKSIICQEKIDYVPFVTQIR